MVEVDTDLQKSRQNSQFCLVHVGFTYKKRVFFFRNQLGIHPKMGEGI